MKYETYTLSNGIRLIFKPENTAITYCGMVINAGSRDESESELGMAHFIEHMLFKGTEKRRSRHIINRLEDVGGELNAYTSKEETVVYASILNEYAERAVELIADIVLHSTFPQKEIDKEVEIIVDEIQSYHDSPSELIYDDFEELLFRDHPIGRNILGTPEVLSGFKTRDAAAFVEKQYCTSGMVFFALGNINFKHLVKWAEKYMQTSGSQCEKPRRELPNGYVPQEKKILRNTHQAHVVIGNRAYDQSHPNRLGMYLLNNIVGGPGMNSLLNLSLREKHGLVYQVDSTFQPMSDTGIWSVYFGCDLHDVKRCEQLVHAELKSLREKPLSDKLIKKYKLQLMGQLAIGNEHRESYALGLGKSYLRYGKIDGLEVIREKIDAVTAADLRNIANEIFDPEKLSVIRYC